MQIVQSMYYLCFLTAELFKLFLQVTFSNIVYNVHCLNLAIWKYFYSVLFLSV
jgi:hypothetical protein